MSIADKITALITARNNIRQALVQQQVNDAINHGFSDFAADIANIGGNISLPDWDEEPTPWERPSTWPNLDEVEFSQGEQGVYITYDLSIIGDKSYIGVYCEVPSGQTFDIQRGHLENNVFVADETYTYTTNQRFRQNLNSLNGDIQLWKVVSTNQIKIFGFCTNTASGTILPIGAQPCVEIKYNLPQLTNQMTNTTSMTNTGSSARITCSALTQSIIGNIDFANSVAENSMFSSSYSLQNVNIVLTNKINKINNMFGNCISLKYLNLTQIDTSSVTDMSNLFYQCSSLRYLIFNFNTSKVTDMSGMFYNCFSLRYLNFNNLFDTSKVTTMVNMFRGCYSLLTLDLSNFNTNLVTSMNSMFRTCYSLNSLILGNNFNTSKVTDMSYMFNTCPSLLNLNLGEKFDTSEVTTMEAMFLSCLSLRTLNLKNKFFTNKVTTMNSMFRSCGAFQIELGNNFNTSNVTDMYYMFNQCGNLLYLDLKDKFDTSKVTNMAGMFQSCINLQFINLGNNFDTSKVTNMASMFQTDYSLQEIDLKNKFDTSSATSIANIFTGCISLRSLDLGPHFSFSSQTTVGNFLQTTANLQYLNGRNIVSNTNVFIGSSSSILTEYVNPIIQAVHQSYSTCYALTRQSILNIINSLPQVSSTKTLTLGTLNKTKLSDAEIAVATQKGWTVA